MKHAINFVICLCLVLSVSTLASAEETNFTDNVRILNGYAAVFHNFENDQIGSIQSYQNHNLLINAFASNLLLRTAGFGITNIHINDNFANASTWIGSFVNNYNFAVRGDNGYVGIGIKKPLNPFHVAVSSLFQKRAIFAEGMGLQKYDMGECNEKSEGFGMNASGIYGCRNDGLGWIRIR